MVSLNRHMDYGHPALAGELLAAAQPPIPDAIRVVMLMSSPAGLRAPIDTLAPGFALPVMYGASPLPVRPRPIWHDDFMEGEVVDEEPRPRDDRRRVAGHPARSRSGLRCLLPRPGVKRAVSFGEFKNQLSAQLAHPERLRDTHRLPCCVQLYRVSLTQPRAAVARRLFGAGASAADLLMFTPDVARRLQLPPPRQTPPRTGEATQDSPWLAAGQEIVELRVIHDHTQESGRDQDAQIPRERSPAQQPVIRSAPAEAPRPAPDESKPPATVIPRVEPAPAVPALRTAIPPRFLTSPDFKLGREEALFDMTVAASARGPFEGIRRITRAFTRRGELERWRALLDGRERDEQLWQVRPPHVALTDRRSREWVCRALTLGGYDTGHMLREWELYWRRRGV
jgi:hypothetical protein